MQSLFSLVMFMVAKYNYPLVQIFCVNETMLTTFYKYPLCYIYQFGLKEVMN